MQIPAEIEKDVAAAKTIVIADAADLAAEARVLETKLVAEKVSVLGFVHTHKAQLIGALVFAVTLVVAFIVAFK